MNTSEHERARRLIALAEAEPSDGEQAWLALHLAGCPDCRAYQQVAARLVGALSTQGLVSEPALLVTTMQRVNARARVLNQQQQRAWIVRWSVAVVLFSACVLTPLSWRIVSGMGTHAGLARSFWQAGFTYFWLTPTLFASLLIVAASVQLTGKKQRQWR